MLIKAIELAENGEDVLFLIFAPSRNPTAEPDKKTLLCLDLEEKFKNHSNITVRMIPFADSKTDNFKGINCKMKKIITFYSNHNNIVKKNNKLSQQMTVMYFGWELFLLLF